MNLKILSKERVLNEVIKKILGVAIFVFLNTLGAFIRIPLWFTPVPITLQTFFVLLSVSCLGIYGSLSQLIYIFLGIGGLPIFSNAGSGLTYLLGPTGGYLIGFVFASFFVAKFIKFFNKFWHTFFVFLMGDLIILILGTLWLKIILKLKFSTALSLGFFPFIFIELIKVLFVTQITIKFKKISL